MLRCVSSRAPSRAALCAVALSATGAQDATSRLTWVYERAVALADIETAAELFELYTGACLESATPASHRTPSRALPLGLED